jgi:hypothetical protein
MRAALILATAAIALAGCQSLEEVGKGFADAASKSLHGEAPGGSAGPAFDSLGLKDILPQFDPAKPISQQFPHVALTIVRSPRGWSGTSIRANHTGRQGTFEGCWTLQAVVWTSETSSRPVGPFDWCSPRDARVTMGPRAGLGPLGIRDRDYTTGVRRTDGPRPPSSIFPEDRHDLPQGFLLETDLSQNTVTAVWLMFGNLLVAMGSNPATFGDYRVWVTRIEA